MSQTSFSLYLYNQWTDFHKLSCAGKPQIRAIHIYAGCTKATTNNWDIRPSVAIKALSANISWTAERIRTIKLALGSAHQSITNDIWCISKRQVLVEIQAYQCNDIISYLLKLVWQLLSGTSFDYVMATAYTWTITLLYIYLCVWRLDLRLNNINYSYWYFLSSTIIISLYWTSEPPLSLSITTSEYLICNTTSSPATVSQNKANLAPVTSSAKNSSPKSSLSSAPKKQPNTPWVDLSSKLASNSKLTSDKHKKYLKNNLCFYCSAGDHKLDFCPKKQTMVSSKGHSASATASEKP